MTTEEIQKIVRPNIQKLIPYEAARHLMNEPAVLLDANENPYGSDVNRYPDPWQRQLKAGISKLRNIPSANIFIGNGSDEIIDLIIRIFCEPGKDNVIITPPTYGMYKVSAAINNVFVKEVTLEDDFELNADKIMSDATSDSRIIFLCSPNNPSGNILNENEILTVLLEFKGIVVIDEAYIEFSSSPSWLRRIDEFENLLVMQTLSKAYGLAGLRIGMAFGSEFLIHLLNKVKPPYNISSLNQKAALSALNNSTKVKKEVFDILEERERLADLFEIFGFVEKIYPSEANFLLVKMTDADRIYNYLKAENIIIRSRSNVQKCTGCLRITIGTPDENDLLVKKLKQYEETNSIY